MALGWSGLCLAAPALAATKTATIGVQVVVIQACNVGTANGGGGVGFGTLDFGSHYNLAASVSVTGQQNAGAIRVNCVNGVPYRVLMNGGNSGNVAARQMNGPGGQHVNYNLYTAASYATVWDNTTGVTGNGNGQDQWLPVFGLVPAQATPAAGTYTDIVVVTVSW